MNKITYPLAKKEVIQSYIVTTARYEFNVYEKRVLYRIIEMTQDLLEGKKLNQKYRLDKLLIDLWEVHLPITALLQNENDTHYSRIKEALRTLSRKFIQYEDDKVWKEFPLIGYPEIGKYTGIVKFKIHEDIYNALLDFSKGFKKYELKTAFEFNSVYAMRFYELFSKQRTPLIFSIIQLKKMFGVESKYKQINDFIRKVIEAAKKELDEKSPYSFTYTPLKTGRMITSIKFHPYVIRENADEEFIEMQGDADKRKYGATWLIEKQVLDYLREQYNFSNPELNNNIGLFEQAQKTVPDLLFFLSEIKAKALRANNPKGYVINALRKKMNIRPKPKKEVVKEAENKAKTEAIKKLNAIGFPMDV